MTTIGISFGLWFWPKGMVAILIRSDSQERTVCIIRVPACVCEVESMICMIYDICNMYMMYVTQLYHKHPTKSGKIRPILQLPMIIHR